MTEWSGTGISRGSRASVEMLVPVRLWLVLIVSVACAYLGMAAGTASASAQCENEDRRIEQQATTLPDCRAYEQVTPAKKESDEPKAVVPGFEELPLRSTQGMRASLTGDRLAWSSEYGFPESRSAGLEYLATRRSTAWTSENVIPPQSVENGIGCPFLASMAAYSSDLSKGVLADGFGQPGSFSGDGSNCGHDEPLLVPGEPEGFQNLFLRDNEAGTYKLVNVTPSNAPAPKPAPGSAGQYYPASFLAGSNDLSHVLFEEELPLTPEAPSGDDLYEWSGGLVKLVTFLPSSKGGFPIVGTLAGATRNTALVEASSELVPLNTANFNHAVSGDGSRVFFQAEGNLYVRENGARTVEVDESQGPGPGGGARFMIASEDGSRVFLTDGDSAGLTNDTVTGSGTNLYEFNVETERLKDLTPVSEANVDGVSGASQDGAYLYFVAEGSLTGTEENGAGASAEAGSPNLYVVHGDATTFIATLDASNDGCDWVSQECVNAPLRGGSTARVAANGKFLGFDSDKSLTGYSSAGPRCVPTLVEEDVLGYNPGACNEVFLYEAEAKKLSCASCDRSGAPPTAPAVIRFPGKGRDNEMRNAYPQRNVSDGGQVFFETAEALAPRATNGKVNVYEYEDGHQDLMSGGLGEADSVFLDASPDGSNVFFATAQPLLRDDSDTAFDIYDARVNGGFPESASVPPSCEGEGCRAPAVLAPVFSAPSSTTFEGHGNVVPNAAKPKPKTKAGGGKTQKKARKKTNKKRKKAHKGKESSHVVVGPVSIHGKVAQ